MTQAGAPGFMREEGEQRIGGVGIVNIRIRLWVFVGRPAVPGEILCAGSTKPTRWKATSESLDHDEGAPVLASTYRSLEPGFTRGRTIAQNSLIAGRPVEGLRRTAGNENRVPRKRVSQNICEKGARPPEWQRWCWNALTSQSPRYGYPVGRGGQVRQAPPCENSPPLSLFGQGCLEKQFSMDRAA